MKNLSKLSIEEAKEIYKKAQNTSNEETKQFFKCKWILFR